MFKKINVPTLTKPVGQRSQVPMLMCIGRESANSECLGGEWGGLQERNFITSGLRTSKE